MIAILLPLVALSYATGPSAPSSGADQRLQVLLRSTEHLFQNLELEQARINLEKAAKHSQFKSAKKSTRARLFAALGRARAELHDLEGAREVFRKAVRWDRNVQLNSSASPKIRAILESIRVHATDSPSPKLSGRSHRRTQRKRPKSTQINAKKPPPTAPSSHRAPPSTTTMKVEVEGGKYDGGWVHFSLQAPPGSDRVVASVRSPRNSNRRDISMVQTSSLSRASILIDPDGLDVWFRAYSGSTLVGTAGTPEDPIRVSPPRSPPSLLEAWSDPSEARYVQTSTRSGLVPVPPHQPKGLSRAAIWGLGISTAVLVAGAITLAVVLNGQNGCRNNGGEMCMETSANPLVSF